MMHRKSSHWKKILLDVAVLKDILVVMADIDYAGSDNWWMISLYTDDKMICHMFVELLSSSVNLNAPSLVKNEFH